MTPDDSPDRFPPHLLRVLAIGDCNTGGVEGASPDTSMPFGVAAKLNEIGFACSLHNLGRTMSTSREGVARMQAEGIPADLLLLNFGLVDAWVTSLPRVYISYYPDHPLKKSARKLLKSLKRRLRSPGLRRWVPVGEVVPIDEYERNIRHILEIARRRNPHVCSILWGTVAVPGDEARSRNITRYNDCLRRIAEDSPRTRYLDTAGRIQGLEVAEAYVDHVHISTAAAERIAAEVAGIFQDGFLNQWPVKQGRAA